MLMSISNLDTKKKRKKPNTRKTGNDQKCDGFHFFLTMMEEGNKSLKLECSVQLESNDVEWLFEATTSSWISCFFF